MNKKFISLLKNKFLHLKTYFLTFYKRIMLFVKRCSSWRDFTYSAYKVYSRNKKEIIKFTFPFCILLIAFSSFSSSRNEIKTNLKDIFKISDEIRLKFATHPDYWGLSTEYILKNDILSKKYINNSKIVLSNGQEILIGNGKNANILLPGSDHFDIIIKNLNKSQCMLHAENKLEKESELKLLSITIINSNGEYKYSWGSELALPIEKNSTGKVCDKMNNTLIWSVK